MIITTHEFPLRWYKLYAICVVLLSDIIMCYICGVTGAIGLHQIGVDCVQIQLMKIKCAYEWLYGVFKNIQFIF